MFDTLLSKLLHESTHGGIGVKASEIDDPAIGQKTIDNFSLLKQSVLFKHASDLNEPLVTEWSPNKAGKIGPGCGIRLCALFFRTRTHLGITTDEFDRNLLSDFNFPGKILVKNSNIATDSCDR